MDKVFLGNLWHWVLLAITTGLLWFFGSQRLHVIEFNLFVSSLLVGIALAVLAVVWFHRPGDRITREELIEDKSDQQ